MRVLIFSALCAFCLIGVGEAKTYSIRAGAGADAQTQTIFAAAGNGDAIRFGEGRFMLSRPLALKGGKIEIRGKGADKTILDFTALNGEDAALTVEGEGVELRDFSVAHAKGAALVVRGSNVNAEALAVSDAHGPGIVLTGVTGAIVQRSTASGTRAGFEVRNSSHVDLIDNGATANDVGVLIDDRPGASAGGSIRIVRNRIVGNAGQGVGIDIVATKDVAILQNQISDHGTAGIFIRAFAGESPDPAFDALSRNITITKNQFAHNGFEPNSDWAPASANGAVFADIVWDGARSYVAGGNARTEPVLLALFDNAGAAGAPAGFLNLGLEAAGAPASEANPSATWPILAHFAPPQPANPR